MLPAVPALAQTTYHLANPFAPWLWPLCAITGLTLQLYALFCKKRLFLLAGLALIIAGTIPERDITLLVGDLLLCAGLWRRLGTK